jgi:hypothetical protein
MNPADLQRSLHAVFLKSPANLFDAFIQEAQTFYTSPAHSLLELRRRENKKVRGDIFEEFCILYLKHVRGYEDVWLLSDIPDDVLAALAMKRQDMGIDIVVRNKGEFYAVQCKYKKPDPAKKSCITWKALSTFYALCMRTGPFQSYIVMTNCDYARHQGKKTEKDVSICLGTFRKLGGDDWLKMCAVVGTSVGITVVTNVVTTVAEAKGPLSVEELRQKRLVYFSKIEYSSA